MATVSDFVLVRFQIAGKSEGLDGTDYKSVPDFFENHIKNISSPDSHGVASGYEKNAFSFRIGDKIMLNNDGDEYTVIDTRFEYCPTGFNRISQEPSVVIRVMLEKKK